MATIKNSARITKRIVLANFMAEEGLAITPMLNGPHGIGKSMIVRSLGKDLNGYVFTVEGGSLKEGEITGLPFASPAADGTTEVRFVKYNVINRIAALEKYYYEVATSKGFLDGKVKLVVSSEGEKTLVDGSTKTVIGNALIDILAGEDNKFKFGNELSGATKMKLIESGEIKPVILFIDELNRTELQTQKELMNIILNKSVNGYDLPWWVSIVSAVNPCSQNSSYATNEMDPAQLDRFLRIKVDANLEDWVDYALMKGVNSDCIEAVAIAEGIFNHKDSSLEDQSEMYPTPRSWEMVAHLYETLSTVNATKFFTAEEKTKAEDDLRVLINGKVGNTAGRTFLENIARKENNIKPQEILTCASANIPEKVMTKFRGQRRLTQKIIADNVFTYIHNNMEKFKAMKTKEKEKFEFFGKQIREFINALDLATQLTVLSHFIDKTGKTSFAFIAPFLSKDVLANIISSKTALKELTDEQ